MPFINILKDGTVLDDISKVDLNKHPLPPEFVQIFLNMIFKDSDSVTEDSG